MADFIQPKKEIPEPRKSEEIVAAGGALAGEHATR